VREVASYVGLPERCSYVKNSKDENDIAIFDFSSKRQSDVPARFLASKKSSHQTFVALVGDALVEPFWPLGTGANRAVLSALDTAYFVKTVLERDVGKKKSDAELEKEWTKSYRIMMAAMPEDIVANFGLHTIDPATRYKKNTLSHFH